MEINLKQVSDVFILAPSGSIDALTAPQISDQISALTSTGKNKLVADFSGVGYTSSAGLRVLLGGVKEARAQGGDLRLAAVQPEVLKVLKLSGFTNIMKLFEDLDTAVASFS
jgi:anti-sigma B factor antagonist